MAADVADPFTVSPSGLYDQRRARHYVDTILSAGDTVPADGAFRNFRGRDPDALFRRFALVDA